MQSRLWQVCAKFPFFWTTHVTACLRMKLSQWDPFQTVTSGRIERCAKIGDISPCLQLRTALLYDKRQRSADCPQYVCLMYSITETQQRPVNDTLLIYTKFTHFTQYIICCICNTFRVHVPLWTFQHMSEVFLARLHLACWPSAWQTDSVGAVSLSAICWPEAFTGSTEAEFKENGSSWWMGEAAKRALKEL